MSVDPAPTSTDSPSGAGLPILDLADYVSGDAELQVAFIAAVGDCMKRHGFARLVGHGIDDTIAEAARAAAEAVFALPDASKLRYRNHPSYDRGYRPAGGPRGEGPSALRRAEWWQVGRELGIDQPLGRVYLPNVWPREVPAFRDPMMSLYRRLENAAMVLLEALAEYLEEPADTLASLVRDGDSVLRVFHPVSSGRAAPPVGVVEAVAHPDVDVVTLLLSPRASALEMLSSDGRWVRVRTEPGEIIANVGEMLGRLTNGVMTATTHRVARTPSGDAGCCILPFFVQPRPDVLLDVLRSCVGEGFPRPQPAITGYALLLERLQDPGLAESETNDD